MKKSILCVVSLLLFIVFSACNSGEEDFTSKYPELFESSSSSTEENLMGEGKLIVNGKESEQKINIYQTYAELPFITILTELGAKIEWNDTVANINFNEKTYRLDITSKTLILTGNNKNLIPTRGNSSYKCDVVEGEIILDDVSLYTVMQNLEYPIKYNLDFDALTVEITLK